MNRTIILTSLALVLGGCSSSDSGNGSADQGVDGNFDDGGMLPSDTDSVINTDNMDALLRRIVSVLNAQPLDALRQDTFALSNALNDTGVAVLTGVPPSDGLTLSSQTLLSGDNDVPQITQLLYTCENGGMLDQLLSIFVNGSPFSRQEFSAEGCQLGANDYNGRFGFSSGFRQDTLADFSSFERVSGTLIERLNGNWQEQFAVFSPSESLQWGDVSYERENAQTTLSVTNLDWSRSGQNARRPAEAGRFFVVDLDGVEREILPVSYDAELTASFSYADVLTNETSLQVTANLSFVGDYFVWEDGAGADTVPSYPVSDLGTPLPTRPGLNAVDAPVQFVDQVPQNTNAQWQAGGVTVTATDGSSLTLIPDPDNRTQVIVELDGAGESTTRLVEDGFQIFCPSVIDGCGTP